MILDQLTHELDLQSGRVAPPCGVIAKWDRLPLPARPGERWIIRTAVGELRGVVTALPGSTGPLCQRGLIHILDDATGAEEWRSLWSLATDPAVLSVQLWEGDFE